MFWQFGAQDISSITTLLEKENVTLDEVLEDKDVLQECKSANASLVKFLCRDDIFPQLLTYVFHDTSKEPFAKDTFKQANMSCELLSTGVDNIVLRMCEEPFFDQLMAVLDKPAPLHPLHGSFFMKLFCTLLVTRPTVVVAAVKEEPAILDKMINHLDTPAIMEALVRLCIFSGPDSKPCEWLAQEYKVLHKLAALFALPADQIRSEQLFNAAQLFVDVLETARKDKETSPELGVYVRILASDEFLTGLLDSMTKGGRTVREQATRFILSLLKERVRGEEEPPAQESERQAHLAEIQGALRTLRGHVQFLDETLRTPPATSLVTSSGSIGAPFGFIRLMALELLETLLANDDGQIQEVLVQRKTMDHLLTLFFQYSDNNFLHRHVSNMIRTLQTRYMETSTPGPLLIQLFAEFRVLQRVMDGWKANSESEAQRGKPVKGYMGFLVTIANDLETMKGTNNFAPFNIPSDQAETVNQWNEFVKSSLAPVNLKWETVPGGEKPKAISFSDDDFSALGANEESVNAEIAFAKYMLAKYTSNLPDDIQADADRDDEDFQMSYESGTLFNPAVPYSTDVNPAFQSRILNNAWRIQDAPEGHDVEMTTDEWNEKKGDDVVKARANSDSEEDNSSPDEDDYAADDSRRQPFSLRAPATEAVLLSPRSAQAVAGMPTEDPFVSPRKSGKSGDSEGGWADFDSPQAMEVPGSDEQYQRSLDQALAEADDEIKRAARPPVAKKPTHVNKPLPPTPFELRDDQLLTEEEEKADGPSLKLKDGDDGSDSAA